MGGGCLTDLLDREERSKSVSVYAIAPVLGLALGPIAGGFIAPYTTWRWFFWPTSIADAFLQLAGVIFLCETFLPVIQSRRAKKLHKSPASNEKSETIPEAKGEPFVTT